MSQMQVVLSTQYMVGDTKCSAVPPWVTSTLSGGRMLCVINSVDLKQCPSVPCMASEAKL